MIKFKGRNGGDTEIRKAKEFAKRPLLMEALKYLGRSPLFRTVWTPNLFKTLADWDMTVSPFHLLSLLSLSNQFSKIVEALFAQIAVMLKNFSNDDPASVTLEAFYHPQVTGSSALVQCKRLPLNTGSIAEIRRNLSNDYLDSIWKDWKNENESFDDFVHRIQTWPDSNKGNISLVCLIDPSDPGYSFPEFVSVIPSLISLNFSDFFQFPSPYIFHNANVKTKLTCVTTAFRRVRLIFIIFLFILWDLDFLHYICSRLLHLYLVPRSLERYSQLIMDPLKCIPTFFVGMHQDALKVGFVTRLQHSRVITGYPPLLLV